MAYTVFSIAYGYRPQSDNDELLLMIKKMMEDFAFFATPGNFLVDIFPIRESRAAPPLCTHPLTLLAVKYVPEWFPGASFRKFGSAAARRINAVCQLPYDKVKERKVTSRPHHRTPACSPYL